MALWDKVRQELEHAGKIAQGALDEGRVRLESFRARQRADQAAQALGYAVYRARQQGQELDSDTYARLSSALAGHEAEAARYESRLSDLSSSRRTADHPGDRPADAPSPATADAATPSTARAPSSPSESSAGGGSSHSSSTSEAPPSW